MALVLVLACAAASIAIAQGVAGRDYLYLGEDQLYIRWSAPPEVWTLLDDCGALTTVGLQGTWGGLQGVILGVRVQQPTRVWRIEDEEFAHIAACENLETLSVTGEVALSPSAFAAVGKLTNLRRMHAPDSVLNDASAEHIAGLRRLEQLWVEGANVGDSMFEALAALSHLRELRAARTRVTDAGIAAIARLRNLVLLDLHGSPIGDASLAVIANFLELEDLQLGRTAISDAGMPHLAKLANLTLLDLQHTNITDAGMSHLAGLKLTWVSLDGTRIGSDGFAHLAGMTGMTHVFANDTLLDDRAIEVLRTMTHLRGLHISGTRITDAGLRRLGQLRELEVLDVSDDLPMTDETAAVLAAMPKLTSY